MAEKKLVCVEVPEPKPAPPPSPVTITVTCSIAVYLAIRFIFPIDFCPTEQETGKKDAADKNYTCEEQILSPSTKIVLGSELEMFTVKIGGFSTRIEAEFKSTSLRSLRINNFIISKDGEWIVCVGKFSKEKRAREMLKILKQYGRHNAIVLSPHG